MVAEQVCPLRSELVANTRTASHSRHCSASLPLPAEAQNVATPPAIEATIDPALPSFEPRITAVPKNARPYFARALSSTLRSILVDSSDEAWNKLFTLPKCVPPSLKSKGRTKSARSLDKELLFGTWLWSTTRKSHHSRSKKTKRASIQL